MSDEQDDRWRRQAAAADAAEIAAHGFTRVPSRTVLVDLLTRLRREAFAECTLAEEVEGVLRALLEAASPATSLRRRDTEEDCAFWDFIERSAAEGRALLEQTHPDYPRPTAKARVPDVDRLVAQAREISEMLAAAGIGSCPIPEGVRKLIQQAAVGRLPALEALLQKIRTIIDDNISEVIDEVDWASDYLTCLVCEDDVEGSLHAPECPILKLTEWLREAEAELAGLRADPAPRQHEEKTEDKVTRVDHQRSLPSPGTTAKISNGDT